MALSPQQPLNGQRVRRIPGLDRRTHDRRDGLKLKVCTVNVGTMKGRSHEVVRMLARRSADICCVQEVRYRGNSTTTLGEGSEKYKFWYSSNSSGINGVGILARKELADNVIGVKRISDRIMSIKLVLGKAIYNILSVYAPQVGRPNVEKEAFREKLEDILANVSDDESIIVGGDLNCHVGSSNTGYEDVMGMYGYGIQNEDGVALLDICKNHRLKVANTYFRKDPEKLITYKSGNAATQIDLILWKAKLNINLLNCKAIPGEECLTQHRIVRADFKLKDWKRKKWTGMKKLKLWRLKNPDVGQEFSQEVFSLAEDFDGTWERLESIMIEASEKTCGRTKGGRGRERESWWWNDGVEAVIAEKKATYKLWQRTSANSDKHRYRQINNRAKKVVAKAKEEAWAAWSEDLNTAAGQQKMFKMAKQMRKDQKDVLGSNFIRDAVGVIKVDPAQVQERWRCYFQELLNMENPNVIEEHPAVHGPIEAVTEHEVSLALQGMKSGKASGPSEVTTEMFKIAGVLGTAMLCSVFNNALKNNAPPEKWAESITIPLYKGKGDALDCGKHRGLRLLEHGMKIWERVLMRRLESHIRISPQQFGFAAGKSTTDASFIARQLQEKYLQNKKELYHIFVDLEKAFDKVPREAIAWALRRQLVPEYLINAVMGLYINSSSQVRSAGGLSDKFTINVGVHQGSALSPLLFKIVMEEATRDVRKGDPWELLYADDLVLTAESRETVLEMFMDWSRAMELRGMKVNIGKTKLLVSGKKSREPISSGQYPCAVCNRGVGANSILCVGCNKWCHKRCSGLNSFAGITAYTCPVCSGLLQQTTWTDESIVLDSGTLEEVSEFCYLGDMFDCEGGAEKAVRHRISVAWFKWRELCNLLCNKAIPLKDRARAYNACIRSTVTYGAATWAITQREEQLMQSCDRRMLRMICGVSLSDRVSSIEILRRCRLEDILLVMRKRRLAWFGHIYRRHEEDNPLRRIMHTEAPGRRPRGRPKKTWKECLKQDMAAAGVQETAAEDRAAWRAAISRLTSSQEGTRRR